MPNCVLSPRRQSPTSEGGGHGRDVKDQTMVAVYRAKFTPIRPTSLSNPHKGFRGGRERDADRRDQPEMVFGRGLEEKKLEIFRGRGGAESVAQQSIAWIRLCGVAAVK